MFRPDIGLSDPESVFSLLWNDRECSLTPGWWGFCSKKPHTYEMPPTHVLLHKMYVGWLYRYIL